MFKRMVIAAVAVLLSISSISVASAERKTAQYTLPIKVLYNAYTVKFPDAQPKIEGNRVLVPIRFVAETLGAQVDYADRLVTIRQDGKVIELPIGSNITKVNGQAIELDVKATAEKGRTYVPLRFVSEALGETVEWDPLSRYVWIGSKKIPTVEEKGIETKPIEEVRKYFIDADHLLRSSSGVPFTGYYVLTVEDLPVQIGDRVYYSIDTVEVGGILGVTIRANDTPNIFYVTSSLRPKFRYPVRGLDTNHSDGTMTSTYRIQSSSDETFRDDKDYMKFRLMDALYIGFRDNNEALILLKNPFRS